MSVTPLRPSVELGAILPALRAPFPVSEMRWKVQRVFGERAQVVGYLDARSVYDRLNAVAGSEWQSAFRLVERLELPASEQLVGRLLYRFSCQLSVCGVTREDVGEGEDPKAAYSDAAKRAAVQFGIGLAIYRLPRIVLPLGNRPGELRRDRRGRLIVDDRCAQALGRAYTRWLAGPGRAYSGGHPEPDPSPTAPTAAAVTPLRPAPVPVRGFELAERVPGRSPYGHETRGLIAALLWGRGLAQLNETQRNTLERALAAARIAELPDELLGLAARSALEQPDRATARRDFQSWLTSRPRRTRGGARRAA